MQQTPEQNYFNVVAEEGEARGAGGMVTVMLCISAVCIALAALICFLV
jgi:hypothetical protein